MAAEQQKQQARGENVAGRDWFSGSPECCPPVLFGALRMKPTAEPFRMTSLVHGAPAPAVASPVRLVAASPRHFGFTAGGQDASSEESIGEETERRRTPVKTIDLGKPPSGLGFQRWLAELYGACCAASNRSRRRTMRFLRAVETEKSHETLEHCTRKWERFDAEIAAACFRFASGEVLRK